MANPNFDAVWARIERHAGEQFRQKRGGTFTYDIVGRAVVRDLDKLFARLSKISDTALTEPS